MLKYTDSKITRMGSYRWNFWKVGQRKTNGADGFEIHWSDDGECVTDHVYTEEDANLIAASPLMLETLKHLQAVGGLGLQNHEYIKKAIDVAEGRLWIPVSERLPETEGYYAVRFENGVEDEKPFRIRPKKNIFGFMTTDKVTHWSVL